MGGVVGVDRTSCRRSAMVARVPRRMRVPMAALAVAAMAMGGSCRQGAAGADAAEVAAAHPLPRAKLRAQPGFDQSSQEARAVFRHRREEVRHTLTDAATARAHLSVIEARIEREKDAD